MPPFAELLVKAVEEKAKASVEKVKETADSISETGLKEYAKQEIEKIEKSGDAVLAKIDSIKNLTPEQLSEQLSDAMEKAKECYNNFESSENSEDTKEGLSDEEKERIKEETGWSDEIVDAIGSWKEYEIYKNAGLIEAEIGGRKCLIRTDIDWDRKWETGKYDENGNPIYETNRERIAEGKTPLDNTGKPIELHHIGQHADSPLAELTFEEHRGKATGNFTILHRFDKETEVHGEGNSWSNETKNYWKARAEYNNGGSNNE